MRRSSVVCVFLCGCAGAQPQAVVGELSLAVSQLSPMLIERYEYDLAACPAADDACAERVEAAWRPVREVLQVIREVWCTAQPGNEGCVEGSP